MNARTISMNLGTIKIAGCTLDAIAYLTTWCYISGEYDREQPYDALELRQEGNSNNIMACYLNTQNQSKYFIMAVFDTSTSKYSFHS